MIWIKKCHNSLDVMSYLITGENPSLLVSTIRFEFSDSKLLQGCAVGLGTGTNRGAHSVNVEKVGLFTCSKSVTFTRSYF